jgi:hypothetical protein
MMCRSIKQLRRPVASAAEPATEAEITAAALQYIRKVSGFRAPSRANQPAFDQAVAEVARVTGALLASLSSPTAAPVAPRSHAEPTAAAST